MTVKNQIISDQIRLKLAKDPMLGAGNFLDFALKTSATLKQPILFLEKEMECFSGDKYNSLTLSDLSQLRSLYAAFYVSMGVERQDLVAVYMNDGVEYLIHYLALTYIGAIPVLTNGNMDPNIAYLHAKRVGCKGLFLDQDKSDLICRFIKPNDFNFVITEGDIELSKLQGLSEIRPYQHVADDPIMIAHSSGTTGVPKAVVLEHEKFFYGVRQRLMVSKVKGGERILSSLPHSHNCAIAYIMLAILSGTSVYIASNPNGASVLKRIQQFQPSMVVSFPQTYVEMVAAEFSKDEVSSVKLWFNGGDAAHETHIRKLIANGSVFVDGMGSSEMGFSLFKNIHTLSSNRYRRCVGKPLDWVDGAILSDSGEKLDDFQIGRLGVKAPSVTSGYWNDSNLTFKSRLQGYFLTGDLAYRDSDGYFYHVDRVPDKITTEQGSVYSLFSEEILMSQCSEILDCSIFGSKDPNSQNQIAIALVRLKNGFVSLESELLEKFNNILKNQKLNPITEVRISHQADIPLGTTGKVLKRQLRNSNPLQLSS